MRSRSLFIYLLLVFFLPLYSQIQSVHNFDILIRNGTVFNGPLESPQKMDVAVRGRIQKGCKADIVILDLKHLQLDTSITNPHQYSEGVTHLLVNGSMVIDDGAFTGELPGRILTIQSSQ